MRCIVAGGSSNFPWPSPGQRQGPREKPIYQNNYCERPRDLDRDAVLPAKRVSGDLGTLESPISSAAAKAPDSRAPKYKVAECAGPNLAGAFLSLYSPMHTLYFGTLAFDQIPYGLNSRLFN